MGVVYGLLTAFGFGTSDFFVTGATRRIGPMRCLYFVQVFGLLGLIALAILLREGPPPLSTTWLRMIALSVIVDFGGMYLLYRAFERGSLSVCSPLVASYAVVTALLAFATGERLPASAAIGTGILILGVIVVSGGGGSGGSGLSGVPEAIGAAVLLGIYFWAIDGITDEMGWLWPVLINRVVLLVCASAALVRAGRVSLIPEHGTASLVLLAAALDTMAQLATNLGLRHDYTTIVTAVGSLYSAVSVLLAYLFLKERLTRLQWSGFAAILAGILLVGH